MKYDVYEIVFVRVPTKSQEEEGVGATVVSGSTPIMVCASSENAAVAMAGQRMSESVNLESSNISARVRVFG